MNGLVQADRVRSYHDDEDEETQRVEEGLQGTHHGDNLDEHIVPQELNDEQLDDNNQGKHKKRS